MADGSWTELVNSQYYYFENSLHKEMAGVTNMKQLLESADKLVASDLETNGDAVLVLLEQAKAILDSSNPDAAMVVNSTITLLNSGASDAASISTLIHTALGML